MAINHFFHVIVPPDIPEVFSDVRIYLLSISENIFLSNKTIIAILYVKYNKHRFFPHSSLQASASDFPFPKISETPVYQIVFL